MGPTRACRQRCGGGGLWPGGRRAPAAAAAAAAAAHPAARRPGAAGGRPWTRPRRCARCPARCSPCPAVADGAPSQLTGAPLTSKARSCRPERSPTHQQLSAQLRGYETRGAGDADGGQRVGGRAAAIGGRGGGGGSGGRDHGSAVGWRSGAAASCRGWEGWTKEEPATLLRACARALSGRHVTPPAAPHLPHLSKRPPLWCVCGSYKGHMGVATEAQKVGE